MGRIIGEEGAVILILPLRLHALWLSLRAGEADVLWHKRGWLFRKHGGGRWLKSSDLANNICLRSSPAQVTRRIVR